MPNVSAVPTSLLPSLSGRSTSPTNWAGVSLPQPFLPSALGPKGLIRVGVTRATLYCSSRQLCLGVYPSSRCAFSVDHALFVPSMRPRSCTSGQ